MSNTLVWTSQAPTVADHMARVAAASRIAAERQAAERAAQVRLALAEARQERLMAEAELVVADWREAGAVKVGFKVCFHDGGKWRGWLSLDDAADFMASTALSDNEDGEFCPVGEDGEFLGITVCW